MASTTWHCMRCRTPTATLQIRPQTLAWQESTNADLLMLESAKQTEYGAKAPKGQTKKVEIEERKRKKHKTKQSKRPVKPINRKKTGTKAAKAHFDTDIAKTQSNRSNKPSTKRKTDPKLLHEKTVLFRAKLQAFPHVHGVFSTIAHGRQRLGRHGLVLLQLGPKPILIFPHFHEDVIVGHLEANSNRPRKKKNDSQSEMSMLQELLQLMFGAAQDSDRARWPCCDSGLMTLVVS